MMTKKSSLVLDTEVSCGYRQVDTKQVERGSVGKKSVKSVTPRRDVIL